MSTVPNHALRQLRAGKLAIGLGVRRRAPSTSPRSRKTAGFDWLFIDCEHSSMDLDNARRSPPPRSPSASRRSCASPASSTGTPRACSTTARRASSSRTSTTAADAQRVADACRYPPVGKRSMGGGLAQLGFASMPVGETARVVNEETLVVVMIESPQGVANADEIAAVPGVDALLIGTNDLCFEMGIPGQFNDPQRRRRLQDGDRRLPQARQVPRHGRHVHARAPRAPHRHGRAAGPERLGLLAPDAGRRARARRSCADSTSAEQGLEKEAARRRPLRG